MQFVNNEKQIMKLFQKILLFLFLFFANNFAQENIIYQWNEITSPTNKSLKILSGLSLNDYFLADNSGDLFHFKNNNWERLSIPHSNRYGRFHWKQLTEEKIFVACMDSDWKTHFYIFQNNKWEKLLYVNPVPVQGITKVDNNHIYIYGNFGTFLQLKNNIIVPIKSFIRNHINQLIYFSNKEIYLGVKAEGLIKFNGESFKSIPFPNNNYNEVTRLYINKRKDLIILSQNSKKYTVSNDTLKFYNDNSSQIFLPPQKEQFGFRKFQLEINNALQNIIVPNTMQVNSTKVFGKSILLTTSDGKIYLGNKSETNYFTNMAGAFNIAGISNITASGFAFINLSNNSAPDLFVLNRSVNHSSRIYQNIKSSPFTDISTSTDILNIGKPLLTHFADFNNDFKTDLITISKEEKSNWLNLFINDNNKFFPSIRVNLSNYVKIRVPKNIDAIDFDQDGDLDIELIYYYGEGPKTGKILLFENKRWGSYFEADTTLYKASRGWNRASIFADFTNSGENDFYLINMWRTNKFLIKKNNVWTDRTIERFSPIPKFETVTGGAIDYDNDGDLDIFLLTDALKLVIYKNNGKGFFKQCLKSIKLPKSNFKFGSKRSMNFGDFNNDGFTDIIITASEPLFSRNFLLINKLGENFIDETDKFKISSPFADETAVADIDDDGDLDIFGTKYGENLLWINNLNDSNFLKINLNGSKSNSEGIGAKIFIYEDGFINVPEHLIAFKQIGSENTVPNRQNDLTAHFGLNGKNKYDIKIQFYGGEIKSFHSVSVGKTLLINERDYLSSIFFSVPRIFYQTINNRTIQIYFLLVLFGFIIVFFEARYAIKKFKWETFLSTGIIITNISLYYLILFLASRADVFYVKFLLPPIILILTLLFTNLIFVRIINYRKSAKSTEEYYDDLLKQIMRFTHGEWALRNLNSLHLYCSNTQDKYDEDFVKQFEERKNTFLQSTAPAINQILLLNREINIKNKTVDIISNNYNYIIENLNSLGNLSGEKNIVLSQISGELVTLIKALADLKKEIFQKFSSNVENVSKNIYKALLPAAKETGIILKIENKLSDSKYALIKNYELADILDNNVHNSNKALKDKKEIKKITIRLYNKVPHICIDIIDTGCGIPKHKWKEIFEQGFSESEGTGFGLHFSQQVLGKYGGRIFVNESVVGEGTIFTIEMIEGVQNAETGITDN